MTTTTDERPASEPAGRPGPPRRRTPLVIAGAVLVAIIVLLVVARATDVFPFAGDDARTPADEQPGDDQQPHGDPLGQVTETDTGDPTCPEGASCSGLQVSCPGLSVDAPAFVAVGEPLAAPRGVIVFFSGGRGDSWWEFGESAEDTTGGGRPDLGGGGAAVLSELQSNGFEVVQVRWPDGWLTTQPGDGAGIARGACRPATVVQWAHDSRYVPMGLDPAPGVCGFCVTGNSSGSSEAAYALTHYGLDGIIDAAVLTSGPPHAALAKGCLHLPGEEAYWFDRSSSIGLDVAYGAERRTEAGPCTTHDPAAAQTWIADGVDTGGNDYVYESTRVVFVFGAKDRTIAPIHARDFVAKLQAEGSPWVDAVEVADMGHTPTQTPAGQQAVLDALLGQP